MNPLGRLAGTRAPLRLVLARLLGATAPGSPRRVRPLVLQWRRVRRTPAPPPMRRQPAGSQNLAPTMTVFVRPPCEPARPDVHAVTHRHEVHWHLRLALNAAAAAAASAAPAPREKPAATAAATAQRRSRGTALVYRTLRTTVALAVPGRGERLGSSRRIPIAWPRLAANAPPLTLSRPARGIASVVQGGGAALRPVSPTRGFVGLDVAAVSTAGFAGPRLRAAASSAPGRSAEQLHQHAVGLPATVVARHPPPSAALRAEVVWRKGRPGRTPTAVDSPAPEARSGHALQQPAAAGALDDDLAARTDSRAAARRAAPPAIDASMVDRLTHEVIQRIERRMRIERERRGL